MTIPFELRPGARVRYRPGAEPGDWRDGLLVRASANGEEWLVKNELGRFWLPVRRIYPVEEAETA